MIVDCHTHVWADPCQLGPDARQYLRRQGGQDDLAASPADHELASRCVDKSLVMGFRSAHLGACVPNDLVAHYVAKHRQSLIGIAAVDPPTEGPDQADELLQRPEFRGLTVSPALQDFHPADSRAMRLYALAAERNAPVFVHQGTHFPGAARMEYARPLLLDEIAREFPTLRIVLGGLGHPWVEEAIALVGKHPHVYADIACLIRRPWQAYNALVLAHQFGVMDKVLFGSDFPYGTAAQAIESVYRLHEVTQGTNLPTVPREVLRSMVERDAVSVLGMGRPGDLPPGQAEQPPQFPEEN